MSKSAIVNEEMKNSEDLIKLCNADIRLGYHSEAHGYKFDVKSLCERIISLKNTLTDEFGAVRDRINQGLPPLSFYLGEDDERRLVINSDKEFYFSDNNYTSLKATEDNGNITLRFTLLDDENDALVIMPEFHIFHPSAPFTLRSGNVYYPDNNNYSFFGKRAEKRRNSIHCSFTKNGSTSVYEISFKRSELGIFPTEPIRVAVARKGRHNETLVPMYGIKSRLIFGKMLPEGYVFITP